MNTVILDFDGTIADTRSLIVRTMQQTIAALQLEPRTDAQCAAMIGLPLKQTFTQLIPMTDATGDLCAETYRKFFDENNRPGAVPVFPKVVETMTRLHEKGCTLTIASSRSRASLLGFVRDMRLENYVSYMVSADDISRPKPDPESVLVTLSHLGITAADALVVGDTTFDIAMGQAAGCKTCGVTYGNHTREQLREQGADYIIDHFDGLSDIL